MSTGPRIDRRKHPDLRSNVEKYPSVYPRVVVVSLFSLDMEKRNGNASGCQPDM